MAEQKELRRMNRTELIEIIYALQQQEQDLRREKKELSDRLDDRAIRLESAGSIAEAALSLNHIFEDAQAAAEQYLMSLTEAGSDGMEEEEGPDADGEQRAEGAHDADAVHSGTAEEPSDAQDKADEALEETRRALEAAQQSVEEAKKNALRILAEAQDEAEQILVSAQARSDQMLASAQLRADDIMIRGRKAAANERDKFLNDVRKLLDENPELAVALQERTRRRISGDE